MIGLIMNLVSKLGNLLLNKIPSKSKDEVEKESEITTTHEVNETNREDIKKNGWSARSILILVLSAILFFAYVIGPLVDGFLGVPLFHEALDPIFKLLMALIVGS